MRDTNKRLSTHPESQYVYRHFTKSETLFLLPENEYTYRMGALSPKEALTSVLHSPVKPLSIYPGETVFTRAKAAHSTARDLPSQRN